MRETGHIPSADSAPTHDALRAAAMALLGNSEKDHLRDLLAPLSTVVRGMALREDAVAIIAPLAEAIGPAAMVRLAWLVPLVQPYMHQGSRQSWQMWLSSHGNLRWNGPGPLALFQIEASRRWSTADEWARSLGMVRSVEAAKIRQVFEHGTA